MEVWKIIFRSKWVISRFQPLIFQGVVPGIYLDSPWPVRVPKKSPFGLIRTFYSPPFSAGYVYVHVYVCVCTYIYIHTYIYIPYLFTIVLSHQSTRGENKNSQQTTTSRRWVPIAPPPAISLQPGLPGRPVFSTGTEEVATSMSWFFGLAKKNQKIMKSMAWDLPYQWHGMFFPYVDILHQYLAYVFFLHRGTGFTISSHYQLVQDFP